MIDKIKQYAGLLYATVLLILGAFLVRQKKKTESVESKLASSLISSKLKESDRDIQEQSAKSTDAVKSFRDLDKH